MEKWDWSRGLAEQVVAAIELDITDRRGLRQEWDQIDDSTKNEIREAWAKIIRPLIWYGSVPIPPLPKEEE